MSIADWLSNQTAAVFETFGSLAPSTGSVGLLFQRKRSSSYASSYKESFGTSHVTHATCAELLRFFFSSISSTLYTRVRGGKTHRVRPTTGHGDTRSRLWGPYRSMVTGSVVVVHSRRWRWSRSWFSLDWLKLLAGNTRAHSRAQVFVRSFTFCTHNMCVI